MEKIKSTQGTASASSTLLQKRMICSAIIMLVALLYNGNVFAREASSPPNVVIVLVDDMGYGDPQCCNPDSKIATPHIDALAADGMRFTDAHAAGPLCHLSRYGLITGRYPFRAQPEKWATMPTIEKDRVTIANVLQTAGYKTAMVGKWHLGFEEQGYDKPMAGGPIHRGFGSYFGIRASTDIPPYFYIRGDRAVSPPSSFIASNNTEGWSKIQGEFWREGGIAPDLQLRDVLPRFTDEAIQVIRSHRMESAKAELERNNTLPSPLMLYVAYPAPHTPWLPTPDFAGKSGAGMYGDFVMMVDDQIGRITKELDEAGMSENTLLIFSSDNGPVWYEGDKSRFVHDCVGGLRGMKADAWEGGHRVPFIVRWPTTVKPGTTSNAMINFVDIMATLADVVGRELPELAGPDSFSFYRVLTGSLQSHENVRNDMLLKSGGGFMTIRHGDWKLIEGLGSGGFSDPRKIAATDGGPKGQLYNMVSDKSEQKNVYAENPIVVRQLSHRLKQIEAGGGQRYMP